MAGFQTSTEDQAYSFGGSRPLLIGESNSIGGPMMENIRAAGLPMRGFVTTNSTKAAAVEALQLAFERGLVRIPNDTNLIGELSAYEETILQTGQTRYAAPPGQHDDMVMSLVIANYGMRKYGYRDDPQALANMRELAARIMLGGFG